MRPLRLLPLLLPALAASCSFSDTLCACSSPPPISHVIAGQARYADNSAAPGLLIRAVYFDRDCGSSSVLPQLHGEEVRTDRNGRFVLPTSPYSTGGVPLDSVCVRVSAYFAPETSAELGSVERSPIRIRPSGAQRPDTLQVSLSVRRFGVP